MAPDDELELLRAAGLLRTLRLTVPAALPLDAGGRVIDDLGASGLTAVVQAPGGAASSPGRTVVTVCGNDYLGLSRHPAVLAAAEGALRRWGWGAGASRLISGHGPAHTELEAALADFEGTDAALVFPSGYQANVSAVTALAGPGDLVLCDKLDHASIFDGVKLSGAKFRTYPHRDVGVLERLLAEARAAAAVAAPTPPISHVGEHGTSTPRLPRVVIVTDGVFSMDGTVAPLAEIAGCADRFGALLIVDEAHGTGVLGAHGRGAAEWCGVHGRATITVGTLSKALGGVGGFVAGPRAWVDLVLNRGRAFTYTTAIPAAVAAAAGAALRVLRTEPARRERLHAGARRLRAALPVTPAEGTPPESPIIPWVLGGADAAVRAAEELLSRGWLAPAVRPPTVPAGTARVRFSVAAGHTTDQLDALAADVREITARSRPVSPG